MHRIDGAGATAGNLFTEGDPATGTAATTVTADWCNDVQENVARAVEAAGIALAKGDFTQLTKAIKLLAAPAGLVDWFAASAPPAGWLKCNGAAVSRSTYADLFAAIGTIFGPGDGATTFNLPDLRGEFIRGWDDSRGVDPGRGFSTQQAAALGSHSHGLAAWKAAGFDATGGSFASAVDAGAGGSQQADLTTKAAGDEETRPRNVALLACIKY